MGLSLMENMNETSEQKYFIMLLTPDPRWNDRENKFDQIMRRTHQGRRIFDFGVEVIQNLCLSDGSSISIIDIGARMLGGNRIKIDRTFKLYRAVKNQIIDVCTSKSIFTA